MNERLLQEMYDDMLDACFPPVKMGNLEYPASVAFYRIDPIAYRVGMSDYESNLHEYYENGIDYEELFGDEEE